MHLVVDLLAYGLRTLVKMSIRFTTLSLSLILLASFGSAESINRSVQRSNVTTKRALDLSAREAVKAVNPNAAYISTFKAVVPQIIVGGEWQTVIVLHNRLDLARKVTVEFFKSDGSVWNLPLPEFYRNTDQEMETTLRPGETRYIPFSSSAGSATFGFGIFDFPCEGSGNCGQIAGNVFLRNHNPARLQDFELSYHLTETEDEMVMPFDQTNWGQVVMNLSCGDDWGGYWLSDTLYEVTIYDELNAVKFQKDYFLKAGASIIVNFAHESQTTWNVRGRLQVRVKAGSTGVVLSGLRINDTGSFTPIQPQ